MSKFNNTFQKNCNWEKDIKPSKKVVDKNIIFKGNPVLGFILNKVINIREKVR